MNYFFPSYINSINIKQEPLPELKITVNSGKNALRLLLRSFGLSPHSKVAIPAFVCNSVKQAVEKEKHTPILFDLKADNTFWTFYDTDKIKEQNIKVVILVHLFGFIHPDTKQISDFCEKNCIIMIHDAAQSYGIDEQHLPKGNGIIYSFGPGKSSAASGGAWIKGYNNNKIVNNIKKPPFFYFSNTKAKLFLKSRIYGFSLSKYESILRIILNKNYFNSDTIYTMCSFQLKTASYIVSNMKNIMLLREKKYLMLKDKIKNNEFIKIAYDDIASSHYKLVLFVKNDVRYFKNYLSRYKIPYGALSESINQFNDITNFKKTAEKIIEISCEASIPDEEIERVATLLRDYR
jgi:dTDP-4-amino-4,6-dideoxygalactose transaminase